MLPRIPEKAPVGFGRGVIAADVAGGEVAARLPDVDGQVPGRRIQLGVEVGVVGEIPPLDLRKPDHRADRVGADDPMPVAEADVLGQRQGDAALAREGRDLGAHEVFFGKRADARTLRTGCERAFGELRLPADELLHPSQAADFFVEQARLPLKQADQLLRAAPVEVGLDLPQRDVELLEGGDHVENVDLRHRIVAVAIFRLDGGGEDAQLVVVEEGVLGHAAQPRELPRRKVLRILSHL